MNNYRIDYKWKEMNGAYNAWNYNFKIQKALSTKEAKKLFLADASARIKIEIIGIYKV